MANWYVGIDESGSFDWSNPEDESFVCAVVTSADNLACQQFLEECAYKIDSEKYMSITSDTAEEDVLKKVIGEFYHGMDVAKNQSEEALLNTLQVLLSNGPNYFKDIFISKPGSDFASNSQHYYMSSLKDVIHAVMSSDIFKDGDHIEFYVAERALECTGALKPVEVVLSQMYSKLRDLPHPEATQLKAAIDCVKKYGTKTPAKKLQTSYNSNLSQYREKLGKSLTNFIKSTFHSSDVSVEVCSAKAYCYPALADQAVNIYNNKDALGILASKFHMAQRHTLFKGVKVENYIEEGDFVSAVNIFMDNLYEGHDAELRDIQHIFADADDSIKDDLWNIVLNACDEKMEQRGTDGDSIQKTAQLIDILDTLVTRSASRPTLDTLNRYYQLRGSFAAHSGKNDFEKEMEFSEQIYEERSNTSSYAEYLFLSKLYIDHMTGSVAQVSFNAYNFDDTMYQTLLGDYQKEVLDRHPFFESKKNFVDDDYAKIIGTIGQAHAFAGKYSECIPEFLSDFDHSSKQKGMVASFLVVANLRSGNFVAAKEWFEKQTLAALGAPIPFEEFHQKFDSEMDMWVALNYLRLAAYAAKQHQVVHCPDYIYWSSRRKGDYPWALLLKWYAYICCLNGEMQKAIQLLNDAIVLIKQSKNFTIESLALSPLRMMVHLSNTPDVVKAEYKELLDDLKSRSSYFADYAEQHQFDAFNEGEDLWDALTMLPFNYS